MKALGLTSVIIFLVCISGRFRLSFTTNTPCALRSTDYGNVCVCNVTYCDYLDPVTLIDDDDIIATSSSKVGLRFSMKIGKFSEKGMIIRDWDHLTNLMQASEVKVDAITLPNSSESQAPNRTTTIKVDRSKKYQKIMGFGGAMTGAVSYNLKNLPQELQDTVYKSFFSKKGIGFTMLRMPIGGCDFDLEPWAYNEKPENDVNLSNFTKLNDLDMEKVEQLKRMKSVTNLEHLKIMASAWSPPKWMKTHHAWTGFSFLEEKYYHTWALYHFKFIELMAEQDMPIWAITTGNEPMNGVFLTQLINFMSLGWIPNKQANWLADHLGPTIKYSHFKDVHIFSNDDQIYTFPVWFQMMNRTRPESMDFLDGLAVHWYWQFAYPVNLVDETHHMYPDKMVFNTEGTIMGSPKLGSWDDGETYSHNYLSDIKNSYNGYIDWNLLLNQKGGPTYVDNFSSAPIIANETSGQEIYKNPIFYVIGHFSKFIPEGSVRVEAERSNKDIDSVAFERPDGTIACIVSNSAQEETVITLADSVRGNFEIRIPPKSLHTIEYK